MELGSPTAGGGRPSFDSLVLDRWTSLKATPVFRNPHYDSTKRRRVERCEGESTQTVPLSVQFNPHHLVTKRPSGMSRDAIVVSRPFDPSLFNFNKASPQEIIAWIRVAPHSSAEGVDVADGGGPDDHPLFINANPLIQGHGLLIPFHTACHPQVIIPSGLHIALASLQAFARPDFRVGFNSLGAWASVNHLHFHTFFLEEAFGGDPIPIESSPQSHGWEVRVGGEGWAVRVSRLTGWPTDGIVVTLVPPPLCGDGGWDGVERRCDSISPGAPPCQGLDVPPPLLHLLAEAAGNTINDMARAGVAHNLVLARGRIIIIPRKLQEGAGAEEGRLVVALAEVCGLGILYSDEYWEGMTQTQYFDVLRSAALPPDAIEAWYSSLQGRLREATGAGL